MEGLDLDLDGVFTSGGRVNEDMRIQKKVSKKEEGSTGGGG